jgi:hypothetical protein
MMQGQDKGYIFFNTLAGRVIIALKKSRIALTVMPTSRKGMSNSQMIGYRIKANKANGQQRTRSINQSKIFITILSFLFKLIDAMVVILTSFTSLYEQEQQKVLLRTHSDC